MKPHLRASRLLLPALAVSILVGCASLSQKPTVVDADAEKVLRRLSSTLSAASSFAYSGRREIDPQLSPDGRVKQRARIAGTVRRPGSFAGTVADDDSTRTITTDGKDLTVIDSNGNVYATVPAKASLDGTIDLLIKDYALKPPMAPFLRADFYQAVTQVGGKWESVGRSKAGGTACDHVRLTIPEGTADLHVAASDGLPRELVITYTAMAGHPRVRVSDLKWTIGVRTSPDQFRARIPSGATRVEMIPAN